MFVLIVFHLLLCSPVTVYTTSYPSQSASLSSVSGLPGNAQRKLSPFVSARNQKRDVDSSMSMLVTFNLSTDTPASCGAGLTHRGVFVELEYRLVQLESPASPWIAVNSFELDRLGISNRIVCCTIYYVVYGVCDIVCMHVKRVLQMLYMVKNILCWAM